MLHEPSAPSGPDGSSNYKMRLGVWMFVPYALIYSGFVFINLVKPILMEKTVLLGLNLAVVYGFGLIALAMVLALIYNYSCARQEGRHYSAVPSKEVR